MALEVPTVTIDDLRAFHAKRFPLASAPGDFLHEVGGRVEAETETVEEYHEEEDDLGYYSDGAKRTLTDQQIAMFRHSEVQAIIRKRTLRREDGELSEDDDASADPRLDTGTSVSPYATTPANACSTADTGATDKVHSGRVEKPKTQQWATSSARTKAKNKKNRNKYKVKKREIRMQKEQSKENGQINEHDDGSESDEWDPWHQARGPDVQTAPSLDLDY